MSLLPRKRDIELILTSNRRVSIWMTKAEINNIQNSLVNPETPLKFECGFSCFAGDIVYIYYPGGHSLFNNHHNRD